MKLLYTVAACAAMITISAPAVAKPDRGVAVGKKLKEIRETGSVVVGNCLITINSDGTISVVDKETLVETQECSLSSYLTA
jgi:hypothetical protein